MSNKMNKTFNYIGWLGHKNLGDEALFIVNQQIFKNVYLTNKHRLYDSPVSLFGGGTLLPEWAYSIQINKYNYAFGYDGTRILALLLEAGPRDRPSSDFQKTHGLVAVSIIRLSCDILVANTLVDKGDRDGLSAMVETLTLSRAAICVLVCVADNSWTRATTCGLV